MGWKFGARLSESRLASPPSSLSTTSPDNLILQFMAAYLQNGKFQAALYRLTLCCIIY